MFGYLIPAKDYMNEEQVGRYKKYYCGLCRSLKEKYGTSGRFFLTYDLTFFALLLSSLYETDTNEGKSVCAAHPIKPREWVSNEILDYAADMSVFLSSLKFLDDWNDEKKLSSLILSNMTTKYYKAAKGKYPTKCEKIEKEIFRLSELEGKHNFSADEAAESFGNVMALVFSYKEGDYWKETLTQCGSLLGRYIYLMDACVDLDEDVKKNRPNPLKKYYDREDREIFFRELLEGYLGDFLKVFDKLPIIDNTDILINTICRGTWIRFDAVFSKKAELSQKGKNKDV